MSDTIIKVDNLTKDYGQGRGIFNISLDIPKGQVFGYVGTNGSGKTTTIRHMMGFVKSDSGTVTITGMDSCDVKGYETENCDCSRFNGQQRDSDSG